MNRIPAWYLVSIFTFLFVLGLAVVLFRDDAGNDISSANFRGDREALLTYVDDRSLDQLDRTNAATYLGRLIYKIEEEQTRREWENRIAKLRDAAPNEQEADYYREALTRSNHYYPITKTYWRSLKPAVDSYLGSQIRRGHENGTIPALEPGTRVDLIIRAERGPKDDVTKELAWFSVDGRGLTGNEIEAMLDQIHAVGVIVRSKILVGNYEAFGYPDVGAFRQVAELYLIRPSTNETLRTERLLGGDPPESISVPAYSPGVNTGRNRQKPTTSGDEPDVEGYFVLAGSAIDQPIGSE